MIKKEFKKIDKLWKLLEVALADANRVHHDKRYKLNMLPWHSSRGEGKDYLCHVCLAGSVMTNWIDYKDSLAPGSFPEPIYNRLIAIENLRGCELLAAYSRLHSRTVEQIEYIGIHYRQTPLAVKLRKLIDLEKVVLGAGANPAITLFYDYEKSLSFYKWLEAELKEIDI